MTGTNLEMNLDLKNISVNLSFDFVSNSLIFANLRHRKKVLAVKNSEFSQVMIG
jgi:hypothetical protein